MAAAAGLEEDAEFPRGQALEILGAFAWAARQQDRISVLADGAAGRGRLEDLFRAVGRARGRPAPRLEGNRRAAAADDGAKREPRAAKNAASPQRNRPGLQQPVPGFAPSGGTRDRANGASPRSLPVADEKESARVGEKPRAAKKQKRESGEEAGAGVRRSTRPRGVSVAEQKRWADLEADKPQLASKLRGGLID